MSKPSPAPPRRIAPSILFCWVLKNSKKMCHSNLYFFISPSFFLRPRLRPFTPETGMLHSTFPFAIYFHSSAFLFLLHFKPENSATTERRKEFLFSENSHFEITTCRNRKEKLKKSRNFPLSWAIVCTAKKECCEGQPNPLTQVESVKRKELASRWCEEWVSECGEKGRKRKFPMWIKHVVAQPVSMW